MIDCILEKYYKAYAKDFLFIMLDMKKTDPAVPKIKVPVPIRQKVAENLENTGELSTEHVVEGMVYTIGSDGEFRYRDEYLNFLRSYSEKMPKYIMGTGIALAGEGRLMESALYLRTALFMVPDDLDVLFNYAKVCYNIYNDKSLEQEQKADFKQTSLQLFEMCCEYHPKFADGYYYLGYFYINAGLYEKARLTWEKYLEVAGCCGLESGQGETGVNKSGADETCADKSDADETYADKSGANETDKQAEIKERLSQLSDLVQYERGYLAVINGNTDAGLELLLPLIDKKGASWNVIYFAALAYRKQGEFEKAVILLRRALSQNPSQADIMNELGLCYAALSKPDDAEKYFKKALIIKENDPDILGNLAGFYINEGKLAQGEEYLIRAQATAPADDILKSWESVLKRKKEK